MTFKQKLQEMNIKMFNIISTKEITYLKELDKRIQIDKKGKFNYYKIFDFNHSKIWNFIYKIEENKVYTLIPFISKNDRPDEPYIILSQQILITYNSNPLLITNYINNKINDTINLYNINRLEAVIIFKYKQVEINFNKYNSF